jgi:glycosyltransferase involved in cell wall biosynthesis
MTAGCSVLMATCQGDRPDALRRALASIWDQQTVRPKQVVLVVDGPVSDELNMVISDTKYTLGDSLNVVRLARNRGLGVALNAGLRHCTEDLVARMDADDVSAPERFEKQLDFLRKHARVAVLGSWIDEVDEDTGETTLRCVPTSQNEIERFAKRRSPVSHVSVVFRKQPVLDVGGYPNFRKWQDYALWAVLLQRGFQFANLSDVLVHVNGGRSLMLRRGLRYFFAEVRALLFQRRIGFLSIPQFLINVIV